MTLSVIHFINLKETPTFAPFSGAENHLWVLLPALRAAGVRVELGLLLQAMGPRIQAKIAELRAPLAALVQKYIPDRSFHRSQPVLTVVVVRGEAGVVREQLAVTLLRRRGLWC